MTNKNLAITLEHFIEAERDCQSMTAVAVLADPKTQIALPERLLSRTSEEASQVGVSPEVLVIALLEVFHEADASVKAELAKNLENLRNPPRA
jgi:hypothetical protein